MLDLKDLFWLKQILFNMLIIDIALCQVWNVSYDLTWLNYA